MRSTMEQAPAAQTGLPPKVEPCWPFSSVFSVRSPKSTAPIGRPPAMPLAVVTMSGVTP